MLDPYTEQFRNLKSKSMQRQLDEKIRKFEVDISDLDVFDPRELASELET